MHILYQIIFYAIYIGLISTEVKTDRGETALLSPTEAKRRISLGGALE